ncbi:MAG: single-stranded-DNA-specific exonuclease RecJ [Tissierellia bacterium]|nr:single-stranded-DNA-specific exonuclease RecJ [Tissierellia bacterium]
MEKWFIRSGNTNLVDVGKTEEEKILYRIIANRGIEDEKELEKFLNPSLKYLNDPQSLKDIEIATDILLDAIESSQKIRIVGDYDVDGVMSTYILYTFIKRIGGNVDYYIPHRMHDGYGINEDIAKKAIEDNISLIITCDNGIAAFDAIKKLKDNDLSVIITDHHNVLQDENGLDIIPNADAIINPKQRECKYPYKNLCGAAVAYKFIDFVAIQLGIDSDEIIRDYLEFAALATICDVMPITDENRVIVKNGLELLNSTVNIGMKALIKASGIEDQKIEIYHAGFVLGPTINSTGRVDYAKMALELLLTKDSKKALEIASKMRELNSKRMKITEYGKEIADQYILENNLLKDDIIIISHREINDSVAGIIAGRIKEDLYRPTIVLSEKDRISKGSARSIDEYNMYDELNKVSDLLLKFGGHKSAAGLSINTEDVEKLRTKLNQNSKLTKDDLQKKVYIELGLPLNYITLDLADKLSQMQPHGLGNPKPIFGSKNILIKTINVFGEKRNVIALDLFGNGTNIRGIMFEDEKEFIKRLEKYMNPSEVSEFMKGQTNGFNCDIIYTININEFRGKRTAQANISGIRINRNN